MYVAQSFGPAPYRRMSIWYMENNKKKLTLEKIKYMKTNVKK